MARLSQVSLARAADMLESGEWTLEDAMIDSASSVAESNVRALTAAGGTPDPAQLKTMYMMLPDWLGEVTDFHPVASPATGHGTEWRVGPGRLFRASAAADDALLAITALVVGFLSAPVGSVLFFASSV